MKKKDKEYCPSINKRLKDSAPRWNSPDKNLNITNGSAEIMKTWDSPISKTTKFIGAKRGSHNVKTTQDYLNQSAMKLNMSMTQNTNNKLNIIKL
jgi:hypothetical protein